MSSKKNLNTERFKVYVSNTIKKLSNPNTYEEGKNLLKDILIEYNSNDQYINLILALFSENAIISISEEKIKIINLFCEIIQKIGNFISKLLTILQNLINEKNTVFLHILSNTYGEMVKKVLKKEPNENKKIVIYEIFQGFCLYNMKQNYKSNQICGTACLSKLIENTQLFLQVKYYKVIYENTLFHLDKPNFYSKKELLDFILIFVTSSETSFRPFAEKTIEKIIKFLSDQDYIKRKLALDIIYTIYNYCKEEVKPLKQVLTEHIKKLKKDKNKLVRESCSVALNLIKEKAKLSTEDLKSSSFFSDDEEKYYSDLLDKNPVSKSINIESKMKNNKMLISYENFMKMKKSNIRESLEDFNEVVFMNSKIENETSLFRKEDSDKKLKQFSKSSDISKPSKQHLQNSKDFIKRRSADSIFKGPKNEEFFDKLSNGVDIIFPNEEIEYNKIKDREHDLLEDTIQNKQSNNIEKYNKEENNNYCNDNTLKEILIQLKSISEKQIVLMDSLQNLQLYTKEQVKTLNNKIEIIEGYFQNNVKVKINKLSSIDITKPLISRSLELKDFNSNRYDKSNLWTNIESLKNSNPDEALNLCLKGDKITLIKFIEKIENEYLQKISSKNLDCLIEKLMSILENGEFIILISSWIKKLFLNEIKISEEISVKVINSLRGLIENRKRYNLSIEQVVDFNNIISTIDKQIYMKLDNQD